MNLIDLLWGSAIDMVLEGQSKTTKICNPSYPSCYFTYQLIELPEILRSANRSYSCALYGS
jgi:hypothetical protein